MRTWMCSSLTGLSALRISGCLVLCGFGDLASHGHCRHEGYWRPEGSQFKILIYRGKAKLKLDSYLVFM